MYLFNDYLKCYICNKYAYNLPHTKCILYTYLQIYPLTNSNGINVYTLFDILLLAADFTLNSIGISTPTSYHSLISTSISSHTSYSTDINLPTHLRQIQLMLIHLHHIYILFMFISCILLKVQIVFWNFRLCAGLLASYLLMYFYVQCNDIYWSTFVTNLYHMHFYYYLLFHSASIQHIVLLIM